MNIFKHVGGFGLFLCPNIEQYIGIVNITSVLRPFRFEFLSRRTFFVHLTDLFRKRKGRNRNCGIEQQNNPLIFFLFNEVSNDLKPQLLLRHRE